ncbi:MAG: hypothetical protein HRU15_15090 [Planctomycetes bacterium]|nr:hypothetical protein [Planctomycetota bacterium]
MGTDPARIWDVDTSTGYTLHCANGSNMYQSFNVPATTVDLGITVKDASGAIVITEVPINFTILSDGYFTNNGSSTYTTISDIVTGEASVTYEPDKDGMKTILVSSPLAGNILKFKVQKAGN